MKDRQKRKRACVSNEGSLTLAPRHRRLSPESSSFLIRFGKDEVTGSNPVISSIEPVRNGWFFVVWEGKRKDKRADYSFLRPPPLKPAILSVNPSANAPFQLLKTLVGVGFSDFPKISFSVSFPSRKHRLWAGLCSPVPACPLHSISMSWPPWYVLPPPGSA